MYAVCGQHTPVVQLLVSTPGILLDLRNVNGWAAVHWAVASRRGKDSPELLSILVRANADPARETLRGWTPLHLAAALNYVNTFQYLVRLPEVMVDATSYDGATPYSIANTMQHKGILAIIDATLLEQEVRVPVAVHGRVRLLARADCCVLLQCVCVGQCVRVTVRGHVSTDGSMWCRGTCPPPPVRCVATGSMSTTWALTTPS
jgi:hypothetical protein